MPKTRIERGPVSISLVNAADQPLPIYEHNGRLYVEAYHGLEYKIVVRNNSDSRLEVLSAIDGRSTLKNEVADLLFTDGMVIPAYHRYVIPGWGTENTSPFVFTALDRQTVAVQATGSNKNLGVIAIAAFSEYVAPKVNYRSRGMAKGLGLETFSYGGNTRGAGMGTGMGDRVDHRNLGTTSFKRANQFTPDAMVEIYTMPHWWLVENGVLSENSHDKDHPAGFRHNDYGL